MSGVLWTYFLRRYHKPGLLWKKRGANLSRLQLDSMLPNSCCHFAVGDIVNWSGIKRVGSAFIMGQLAATNIVQKMLQKAGSLDEPLATCPEIEPMMALTVGETAIVYQKAIGVMWGRELREKIVGRGLGIDGE